MSYEAFQEPIEMIVKKQANIVKNSEVSYIAFAGEFNDDFDEYEKYSLLLLNKHGIRGNYYAFYCARSKNNGIVLKVIDIKNKKYDGILEGNELDKFAKEMQGFYDLIAFNPETII